MILTKNHGFFRILFDLNCVHWCSLIQTVIETLKLNSIISNAVLRWGGLFDWIGTSLKKVAAFVLCLNTVSMVFNKPAWMVSSSNTWCKKITDDFLKDMIKLFFFSLTENLHHELPKPFPSAALLQLDFVAVKNVVIKVHVVPGNFVL